MVFLSAWVHGRTQMLTPQTLGSFGRSSANGGILLEDHIGSIQVSTLSTPTFLYTQGFLHPDAGTTPGPVYINNVTLSGGGYGVDNAGTTFIRGGVMMLEFTVGEFACATLNSPNNQLTQGILQPYPGNFWTGLVNTDWMNTGNWSAGVIPTPVDDVVIPAGCPHYPVITNGIIAECKSISLNAGSSATVNSGGLLKVYN